MLTEYQPKANVGIFGGIATMVISSGIATRVQGLLLVGAVAFLIGWGLFIFGCVNLSRGKGYSPWLGLLGLLFFPGLVILFLIPDRKVVDLSAVPRSGSPRPGTE